MSSNLKPLRAWGSFTSRSKFSQTFFLDVLQAYRIEFVKRAEFASRIPPFSRHCSELGDFTVRQLLTQYSVFRLPSLKLWDAARK